MDIDNRYLWQEICYILRESVQHSVDESKYELNIIRVLEKIGWSQYECHDHAD